MADFSKLLNFLQNGQYQMLKNRVATTTDYDLVLNTRSVWDAQINLGDVIPPEISFPVSTMNGVTVDWDDDKYKFVIYKGTVILRDNLTDDDLPLPYDDANDQALIFYDDEFAVLEGTVYDDELIILDLDRHWWLLDGDTYQAYYYVDTEIDDNDVLYTVYADHGTRKLIGLKWENNAWSALGTPEFSDTVVELDLKLDNNGIPYVAYTSLTTGKPSIYKFNGSDWELVGSANFSPDDAIGVKIAFDTNNDLYVAYQDADASDYVSIQKWGGSSWSYVGSQGASTYAAMNSYVDMIIDGADNIYIAYKANNGTGNITVDKWSGSSWAQVGSNFPTGAAEYISIINDSSNNIYVSYQDTGNFGYGTVRTWGGSSWDEVGGGPFNSSHSAVGTKIRVDGDDNIYVAYALHTDSYNHMTVSKYDTSWSIVDDAEGFTESCSSTFGFSIDSNDKLYLAVEVLDTNYIELYSY